MTTGSNTTGSNMEGYRYRPRMWIGPVDRCSYAAQRPDETCDVFLSEQAGGEPTVDDVSTAGAKQRAVTGEEERHGGDILDGHVAALRLGDDGVEIDAQRLGVAVACYR